MTRGVADDIRLGLDAAAGRHAIAQLTYEHFADEKARGDAIVSSNPPDQMGARGSRLEGVTKVLGFAGNLAIEELHDAHRVGWLAIISEDEFRDPEIAPAYDAAHAEALRVRLRGA